MIHRDIKPAIILGRHGETLVVDWGLAKAIGRPKYLASSWSEAAAISVPSW